MGSVLGMLIIYLLINALLLGVGIGIGFLLRWMLPAIDLGISILIGVVAASVSIYFFTQLGALLGEPDEEETEPEARPKVMIYPIGPITSGGRRKRQKSSR